MKNGEAGGGEMPMGGNVVGCLGVQGAKAPPSHSLLTACLSFGDTTDVIEARSTLVHFTAWELLRYYRYACVLLTGFQNANSYDDQISVKLFVLRCT